MRRLGDQVGDLMVAKAALGHWKRNERPSFEGRLAATRGNALCMDQIDIRGFSCHAIKASIMNRTRHSRPLRMRSAPKCARHERFSSDLSERGASLPRHPHAAGSFLYPLLRRRNHSALRAGAGPRDGAGTGHACDEPPATHPQNDRGVIADHRTVQHRGDVGLCAISSRFRLDCQSSAIASCLDGEAELSAEADPAGRARRA